MVPYRFEQAWVEVPECERDGVDADRMAARWALDEQIRANKDAFKRLPRNRGGLFGAGCWEDKEAERLDEKLPPGMLDPFEVLGCDMFCTEAELRKTAYS